MSVRQPSASVSAVEVIDLIADYRSLAHFLRCMRVGAEESLLFVPHEFDLPVRVDVWLMISIGGIPTSTPILGRVAYSVCHPTSSELSGAVISIGHGQQQAFGRVVSYARSLPSGLGRRAHPRFQVWLPIDFTNPALGHPGFLADLSEGGARVETWLERPPLHQRVRVQVPTSDWHPLELQGDVVSMGFRRGIPGFGFQFVDLSLSARSWLRKILDTRGPIAPGGRASCGELARPPSAGYS